MSRNSWSKPNTHSHYFMLPNEIFSLNLCAGELSVYAYLLYLENRKTHECYPSYKTIGVAVGISSRNTVKKYVDMLEEKRLITTCPTKLSTTYGIHNGNLLYHIEPIILAIQYRDYIAKQRIEAEHERLHVRRTLQRQHRENVRANNWRARLERRNEG